MISLIEPSPFDAATAYIAVNAHKLDNFKPYIFNTSDFGKSWTKIVTGLPENIYVHAVREDPKRKGLLYAGTETGIYVSFNDGANWQPLQLNLPVTPVHDMVIHDDALVVATHGRSFWVLDDLSPLRQSTATLAAEDAHLFTPTTAFRTREGHVSPRRYPIGENPPSGAILYYYLKEAPKDPAKLELLDADGKVIRSFSSEEKKTDTTPDEGERDLPVEHIPVKAGLNLFVWDLRYEPPTKVSALIYDSGEPAGPLALAGKYQARLTVAGKSQTAQFEVKMDPRVQTSAEDLRKQFDLMLKMSQRQDLMNKTVIAIRDLRTHLQSLVDSADTAPTVAESAVFADLDQRLEAQLTKWREVLTKDLPALNDSMRKNNVPLVAPAATPAH